MWSFVKVVAGRVTVDQSRTFSKNNAAKTVSELACYLHQMVFLAWAQVQ